MLRRNVLTGDVVEPAIEGLGDDRDHEMLRAQRRLVPAQPLDTSAVHGTDRQRIGDQDRRLQQSVLVDLRAAGHFAGPIEDLDCSRDERREGGFLMCVDRGDAGPGGAPADTQLSVTVDHRRLADTDTGNVRDGIERTGWVCPDDDAQIAQPRSHALFRCHGR